MELKTKGIHITFDNKRVSESSIIQYAREINRLLEEKGLKKVEFFVQFSNW